MSATDFRRLDAAAGRLRDQRDQARAIAVALEQELDAVRWLMSTGHDAWGRHDKCRGCAALDHWIRLGALPDDFTLADATTPQRAP